MNEKSGTHGSRVGCSVCVSCGVGAKDVVVWAMLGVQHVPKREDMPSVTTGTTLRFILLPFNYFEVHSPQNPLPVPLLNRPMHNSWGTLTIRRATRVGRV